MERCFFSCLHNAAKFLLFYSHHHTLALLFTIPLPATFLATRRPHTLSRLASSPPLFLSGPRRVRTSPSHPADTTPPPSTDRVRPPSNSPPRPTTCLDLSRNFLLERGFLQRLLNVSPPLFYYSSRTISFFFSLVSFSDQYWWGWFSAGARMNGRPWPRAV